jgi:hypothetical protein
MNLGHLLDIPETNSHSPIVKIVLSFNFSVITLVCLSLIFIISNKISLRTSKLKQTNKGLTF